MIETKIIDGHRYLVTYKDGVIIKKEGRDLSPLPVPDPEKDAAQILANKGLDLTLPEIGKLIQFLVKRRV
ncbi:MAG: hypothetical protein J3T61_10535 [Candidatus Brocadiales bacterium]|nr:hypothetical protein [Candidatus Bathyanammoxibius sp.]